MAPRRFNRYMVALGMGTHPKFARLTDAEFRAHVVGVLAVAAMAPVRGRLLVGALPAEPVDIATAAGVTEKVAESAMRKLMAVGVLRPDEEHNCLRVHDWEDVNPPPKTDESNAKRQAAFRARNARSNGESNGRVTPPVTTTEVEVEVEPSATQKNNNAELRSAVRESFAYWQEQCGHQQAHLSPDRASKVEARLRERQRHHDGDLHAAVLDVRQAVDGAARAPFVNDAGKRFDDIELICRNGSKLEDFMGRASSPERGANVTPLRRSPVLEHADRWQRHYPNRQEGSA